MPWLSEGNQTAESVAIGIVNWDITFSEPVTNVNTGDFQVVLENTNTVLVDANLVYINPKLVNNAASTTIYEARVALPASLPNGNKLVLSVAGDTGIVAESGTGVYTRTSGDLTIGSATNESYTVAFPANLPTFTPLSSIPIAIVGEADGDDRTIYEWRIHFNEPISISSIADSDFQIVLEGTTPTNLPVANITASGTTGTRLVRIVASVPNAATHARLAFASSGSNSLINKSDGTPFAHLDTSDADLMPFFRIANDDGSIPAISSLAMVSSDNRKTTWRATFSKTINPDTFTAEDISVDNGIIDSFNHQGSIVDFDTRTLGANALTVSVEFASNVDIRDRFGRPLTTFRPPAATRAITADQNIGASSVTALDGVDLAHPSLVRWQIAFPNAATNVATGDFQVVNTATTPPTVVIDSSSVYVTGNNTNTITVYAPIPIGTTDGTKLSLTYAQADSIQVNGNTVFAQQGDSLLNNSFGDIYTVTVPPNLPTTLNSLVTYPLITSENVGTTVHYTWVLVLDGDIATTNVDASNLYTFDNATFESAERISSRIVSITASANDTGEVRLMGTTLAGPSGAFVLPDTSATNLVSFFEVAQTDTTSPTVAITPTATTPTISRTTPWQAVFSERIPQRLVTFNAFDITGTSSGSTTIDPNSISTSDNITYTFNTITTSSLAGTLVIETASGLADTAGNAITSSTSTEYTLSQGAPILSEAISNVAPAPASGDSTRRQASFTLTFEQPVTTTTITNTFGTLVAATPATANIVQGNLVSTGTETSGSFNQWSVPFTYLADYEGDITFTVTVAELGIFGNGESTVVESDSAFLSHSFRAARVARVPQLASTAITRNDSENTRGGTVSWTVHFDQQVVGVGEDDFVALRGGTPDAAIALSIDNDTTTFAADATGFAQYTITATLLSSGTATATTIGLQLADTTSDSGIRGARGPEVE